LIDIDGTLTLDNGGWTETECLSARPNLEMIKWVEARYKELHHIIIFTARHEKLRQATNYWLKKNHVYFHALRMGKVGCDLLIDDKTVTPERLLAEWKEEGE
jgi:uncharacterized HAD superfamily protein